MKINITSIPVADQEYVLSFYTEKLGFVKKEDAPMGEHRWLTVVSTEGADGVELLLEPLAFAPSKDYQQALYSSGIPVTSFGSDDLEKEVEQLKSKGVIFTVEPQNMGDFSMAIFDDSCGNLICLTEKHV